ncbi:hypothetical protein HDU82_002506, partial [Entophlyctis luteolus]
MSQRTVSLANQQAQLMSNNGSVPSYTPRPPTSSVSPSGPAPSSMLMRAPSLAQNNPLPIQQQYPPMSGTGRNLPPGAPLPVPRVTAPIPMPMPMPMPMSVQPQMPIPTPMPMRPTHPTQQQQQQQQLAAGPDTVLPVIQFLTRYSALVAPHLDPQFRDPRQWRQMPPEAAVTAIVKYLTSVQMPPRDINISRTPSIVPNVDAAAGKTGSGSDFVVRVSFRGVTTLDRAAEMKRTNDAAIVLQKTWRGVRARRLVQKLKREKREKEASHAALAKNSDVRSSLVLENGIVVDKGGSDKLERRKSKVNAFKSHLLKISNAYEDILNNGNGGKDGDAPTEAELEFMRIMNSDETFRLSLNLRAMHKLEKSVSLEDAQRNYEAMGGVPGRSPAQMYHDYGPRVVEWIVAVLSIPQSQTPPSTDLVALLRPADILCLLAVNMFPHVQCKLLNKGPEFTIHKAVFFLELCKTVGVKPGMLFSLKDLFLGGETEDPTRKSGVAVLRTVCALERQARRRGWDGPVMVLKADNGAGGGTRASLVVAPMARGGGGTFDDDGGAGGAITLSSLTKRGSKLGGRGANSGGGGAGGGGGGSLLDPSRAETVAGGRKSFVSSRSSQDSMRNSRQQIMQQHYVTSLPANFKLLSRDEKVSLLIALPANEARESLRILYASVQEKFEYEDLMAIVWANENAETAKQEEHDMRVRLALQVREAVARRNDAVRNFLAAEEIHSKNLSFLAEYLENTVSYRLRLNKRRSRGLSTSIQVSPTKTIDIYTPQVGESTASALSRVEAENEELVLLERIVKEIYGMHSQFVEELKFVVEVQEAQESSGLLPMGDALMTFAGSCSTAYITYAAVALNEESVLMDLVRQEESDGFVDENGEQSVTFANSVVKKFVEDYQQDAGVGGGRDMRWYLAYPLQHLGSYTGRLMKVFEAAEMALSGAKRSALSKRLASDNDVGAEWRLLVREERRLELVGVKMGSVSKAIESRAM